MPAQRVAYATDAIIVDLWQFFQQVDRKHVFHIPFIEALA